MPRTARPCVRCEVALAEWKSQYCAACKQVRKDEQRAVNRERERSKRQDPAYRERQRIASADRRRREPEKTREALRRSNRKHYYRRTYNLTSEEVEVMRAEQGGACAICRRVVDQLHVDHDAETGVVRGLLCGTCNRGIGSLKHSIENLQRAIAYLTAADDSRLKTGR